MAGKVIGYHRTSTKEQNLARGIYEITEYCRKNNIPLYNDIVYTDQCTGKNFDRPVYRNVKKILEKGDTLIVTEIDRLGRDKAATLKDKGIHLMVLELPSTLVNISANENSTVRLMEETMNNIMIELYTSFAHAEMEKRIKRQREGIAQKKASKEWSEYGRPRVISKDKFAEAYEAVLRGEITPTKQMRKLGLKKSTYYHYKKQYDKHKNTVKSEFKDKQDGSTQTS